MIIITLLSIITALLVVTSTSTVYSVLWLVGTFLIISAFLGFINLGFVALLYVIVYVGAIAILFLFVVQLLDLGSITEQPVYNTKLIGNSNNITPLIIIISLALLSILFYITYIANIQFLLYNQIQILFYDSNISTLLNTNLEIINSNLLSSTIMVSSSLGNTPQVSSIAQWFYGPGLLPLIIISIILLVAMISPIYLCKDNN